MKKMFMIFSLISSVAVLLILAAIGMSGKLTPQAETNGQQQWLTPEVIQAEQIEDRLYDEIPESGAKASGCREKEALLYASGTVADFKSLWDEPNRALYLF